MKSLIALVMLVAGGSSAVAGQQVGRLSGVVRDATGLPLSGVEVVLSGPASDTTVITKDDGVYEFPAPNSGSHQLNARKSGFREWVRGLDLESAGSLEIAIDMVASYAETTIVTASRGEESLLSTPASVTVIGSQEIHASAADNFADLLRGVPGLNITQFGARDINVNTRSSTGVLSNSMLVMVDGRSFFQPFYGSVDWDLLTMTKEEIDQIEVLRSPASALWGANALSGVINVRTKSPRQMMGLRGDLSFGEWGTKAANVTWADATDRLSYRLSGSYYEQDAWDRDNVLPDGSPMPPNVLFENRGTAQPKFDARVDWDADRSRVWSIRGGLAGANGLVHSALGPLEFMSDSYASYAEVDHHRADLDVKVYWNHLKAPFELLLFGLPEGATSNTYVSDVTKRVNVKTHGLTFGGSVRLDRFDIAIAAGDSSRLDAGAFIEDKVKVTSNVAIVVGGRVDKFDTTEAVFAPRLGVTVSPTLAHSFRLTYNRAYRAPSLLENFVNVSLPTVVPIDPPFYYTFLSLGSTDLEMERQDAVEVGYTGILNRRTTVSATVYNQGIKNNIWYLPVSFYGPGAPPPGWPGNPNAVPILPKVFSFVNLGRVRDRGVELTTNMEWPRLSMQASYTFQDTPRLEETSLPLQINQPARHQGGGGVTFTDDQWTVGGDVHYTDKAFWADVLTAPFWGYTDAYVNANARVSYRLRGVPWELWLGATNLFDEKIKSHVFGDTVRRKVTAGVHWQWK